MHKSFILLLLVASLAACTPADPGEIIPTRTPLPPPTATPVPPTPTPTTTPIPTLTPTPLPQPTSTPETGLSEGGPWLLMSVMPGPEGDAPRGLFAVNADGTGLTQLTDDAVQVFAGQSAASPASPRAAYIARADASSAGELLLKLVRLPGGQDSTAASLMPPGYAPPESREADEALWQALQAVQGQTPRWASDGDHIAFVAFREGPTADIYLYNLFTRTTVRLSTEPGQAVAPRWSPDGRFIVYGVHHDIDVGDFGLVDEVRVAWTNGSGDKLLYPPAEAGERLFGWLAYNRVLVATADGCAYTRLRAVEPDSGAEFMLWPGHFRQAAFDPATGTVLLEAGDLAAMCVGETAAGPGSGLFLVPPGGEARPVSGVDLAEPVQMLRWAESQDAFVATIGPFGQPPGATLAITPGGAVTQPERPPGLTSVVSPDGELMAWYGDGSVGESGLWVGRVGGLPEPVFDQPVGSVTWSPSSQALFFFRPPGTADTLAYAAHRPGFRPVPLADHLLARNSAWVRWP